MGYWGRGALGVALCAGLPVSGALAVDWTVKSFLSQSVDVSNNRDLRTHPEGLSYGSFSTIALDALARTPTSAFGLNADLTYRTYAGDTDLGNGLDNGARARFETTDKLSKYNLVGAWRRQDAAATQLIESGVSRVRGDMNTFLAEGGVERRISPIDSIVWSARATSVDFTSPTPSATPFVDLTTTGAWVRRLTRTTDWITSLQFEWLARDDAANSETIFGRATTGLRSELLPGLTFKGAVGGGFFETTNHAVLTPSSTVFPGSGSSAGVLADMDLTYKLRTTAFSVFAVQSMAPDSLGDIQTRTAVGLRLYHDINQFSNLMFAGEFSRITPAHEDTRDFYTLSATYGHRLAREWYANVSYQFLLRNDDLGAATSNRALFRLTHDMTIWAPAPSISP